MLANLHISVGAAGGGLGKNTINIRHEMRRGEREGVLMKNYLNIKIYGMNISWLSVSFIEARDASDFKSILDQSKSLRLILRKS